MVSVVGGGMSNSSKIGEERFGESEEELSVSLRKESFVGVQGQSGTLTGSNNAPLSRFGKNTDAENSRQNNLVSQS